MQDRLRQKAGGYVALGGTATFLAALVALHRLQPDLRPRDEAVSYYVHGHAGWLLSVGLLAWGAGSLALAFALADRVEGRWAGASRWLLGVWGAGVLLGGIFPADPPGSWSEPLSLAGMIHGNAALVAFLALPLSALCLAASFRQDESWRSGSGLYLGLAVATMVSLLLFMASIAPVFVRPGPPVLLGLSERVLLVVYAAWLASVGAGSIRRGGA